MKPSRGFDPSSNLGGGIFIKKISLKEFKDWLEKLKEKSKNSVVLVEGVKDKRALESFGVKNVIRLRGRALYKVVEDIKSLNKKCIILVDLDKEGKRLYAKLNRSLNKLGVKVDKKFREFLFKTELRQIEGMVSYIKKLR